MSIVQEADMVDQFGNDLPLFPYKDSFHIALVTAVKSKHDME